MIFATGRLSPEHLNLFARLNATKDVRCVVAEITRWNRTHTAIAAHLLHL
jgi:hypothetical protein